MGNFKDFASAWLRNKGNAVIENVRVYHNTFEVFVCLDGKICYGRGNSQWEAIERCYAQLGLYGEQREMIKIAA